MSATVAGVVLVPHSGLTTTKQQALVFNPFLTGTAPFRVQQLTTCKEANASGKGGGALGARMNLFERFARVIKSYANEVISGVLEGRGWLRFEMSHQDSGSCQVAGTASGFIKSMGSSMANDNVN